MEEQKTNRAVSYKRAMCNECKNCKHYEYAEKYDFGKGMAKGGWHFCSNFKECKQAQDVLKSCLGDKHLQWCLTACDDGKGDFQL